MNGTRYSKNNNARFVSTNCFPQTAFPIVIQICNDTYFATTAAGGVFAKAFCTGKSDGAITIYYGNGNRFLRRRTCCH